LLIVKLLDLVLYSRSVAPHMGNITLIISVIHLEGLRKTKWKSVTIASLFVLVRLRLAGMWYLAWCWRNSYNYLSLRSHVLIYLSSNKAV